MLLDTHCHPDFVQDPTERAGLVRELADDGIRLVAQTMTPTGFGDLETWLEETDLPAAARPLPALGLHPWTLRPETAEADVDTLLAALPGRAASGRSGSTSRRSASSRPTRRCRLVSCAGSWLRLATTAGRWCCPSTRCSR